MGSYTTKFGIFATLVGLLLGVVGWVHFYINLDEAGLLVAGVCVALSGAIFTALVALKRPGAADPE